MRLINKSIYALALASMMGLWSCSQDEDLMDTTIPSNGKLVPISITVTRGNAMTRTALSDDLTTGGLNDVWCKDDVIYIYDSNGGKAGELTLVSGEGTPDGSFSGTMTASDDTQYRIWYFGHPDEGTNKYPYLDFPSDENYFEINLGSSSFASSSAFSALDILSEEVVINITSEGVATVNESVQLTPYLALARFSLKGVSQNTTGYVTICNKLVTESAPDMGQQCQVNLATGQMQNVEGVKYSVIDNVNSDDDIYVAFIPGDYKLGFTFVKEDGTVYRHNFSAKTTLESGKYYNTFTPGSTENGNNGTIEGVPVDLKLEDSNYHNPGDMDSWASEEDNLPPYAEKLDDIVFVSNADGWTLNDSNRGAEHYGGFGYYIDYIHNGISSGILTSKNNDRKDTSAIFYQWGRWLGFPFCANYIYLIPEGDGELYTDGTIYPEMIPLGVNYGDIRIGYSWWNSGSGCYVSAYMGANSSWTKERAINCSICYGLGNYMSGHLDYVYNNEECSWEERGTNPAPDGYSIPTSSQLEALIPETPGYSINTNTAIVKVIDGVKYAMLYKKTNVNVGGKSTLPAVEIKSFRINENTVKNTDSRFNTSKSIKLVTYGCLDNSGDLINEGSRGYFWSNESGKNVLNNTTGNGGEALYVYINNNKITFGMTVLPRTFAANVYLFKNDSKKSDTLKPWFPLTGVNTPHWW